MFTEMTKNLTLFYHDNTNVSEENSKNKKTPKNTLNHILTSFEIEKLTSFLTIWYSRLTQGCLKWLRLETSNDM